jgi:hypothetical protein
MANDIEDLVPAVTACRILGGDQSPINHSTLWRWVRAGRVRPRKVGPRTVRYSRRELLALREGVPPLPAEVA